MDSLQLYISYMVLTIFTCSVAIVALSFSTGSTSKQIALIGELIASVDRARMICDRARSAALWSAGDSGRFVGMSNLLSFPPEPHENVLVEQANQHIQALRSIIADSGDLRLSSLRRQIAEVKMIEANCNSLLLALEMSKKPGPVEVEPEADPAERFQRLVAFQ